MRQVNKKTPFVFYASMVLLCLVMISSSMTGGLFARYTTSVTGSDSARVAKFDVSITDLTSTNLSLNSFDQDKLSANTTFTVTSNSEVTVKYSLVVTFPSALPAYLTLTLDGNSATTVSGNTYTFTNVGSFAPGTGNSATHKMTFAVAPGLQAADVSMNNISVDVIFEQID